jgi:NADPH-dependent 2,4-dienoyl-CoA reductase/sulfur reductase-like enzyme/rhodanese-related sulfurtransferase
MTRLLIVGGVAGGAAAAARARRIDERAEILLFERGADISFANCGLPYHIGGVIEKREALLVQTAQGMARRFNVDVRTGVEVLRIDRAAKAVVVREASSGVERREAYDKLILSPGAAPIVPAIPGIGARRVKALRSMADMDAILALAATGKSRRVAVVGGGYIGLEMAEALHRRGFAVTVVEMAPQVMAPLDPEMAVPVQQHLAAKGVQLRLNAALREVVEEAEGVVLKLSAGDPVPCDFAVLAVGVRPESRLAAEAGLELGEGGGIVVDDALRTSDPDIYAVGDAVLTRHIVSGRAVLVPLAGPASRQGRIAAANALGRAERYKGTQGTAICKVFDLTVAATGLNEKTLARLGIAYEAVYVHPPHHAAYYPGAQPMSLKLLFAREGGRILGAQAVGGEGVDKRIDVLAVALRAGLTVYDLEELELCYAPPYGSARDPVNYAGFVAANVLRGDVALCRAEEVLRPKPGQVLLDVRNPIEVAAGGVPGALNIPVDLLRARLAELPRDAELLVFCQVGLRGYLACRILSQNGFRCRNLSGGYKTLMMFKAMS